MTILDLIEEKKIKKNENDPWKDNPYKDLLKLTIDERGSIGEQICSYGFHTTNCIINEDITDVNNKGENVHYDIKVNNKYIEIKTAYRDSNNCWQHENIYKNSLNCDAVLFIDFDYTGIHFSLFKISDLPLNQDSIYFPRKHGTLRQNRDDGYKLDFSKRTFSNFKQHYKFFTNEEVTFTKIGLFLQEEFNNYVTTN